ncbi:hypothetical protein FACS189427_05800 [Planctomycetales bacterium]|nr:hypothetical protein FACS189427_05800 [Planctomycetales bacterium]
MNGCKKTEKANNNQNNTPETQVPAIPLPSKESLDALGPENDLNLRFVLPDSLFIIAGQPKKFFASGIGKGNEGFFAGIIGRVLVVPFNIAKAERFIISFAPCVLNVETDNNGVKSVQPRLIFRRTITFQFDTEIKPEELLNPLMTENTTLDSIKKKIGETEYYDLTDPNNAGPSRVVIHFADPKTLVLIEGVEQDLTNVLTGGLTPPASNAVVLRAKHLDLQKTDIAFVASREGTVLNPQFLTQLLGAVQEIPQGWAAPLAEHFKAVQITASAQSESGKPMLNVLYDATDEKGAAAVAELIQGVIINAQTYYASLDEQGKKGLTFPIEYISAALNGMEIKAEGTQAVFVINNFDGFEKTLTAGIQNQKTAMQQSQLAQAKHDQLVMLARCFAVYEQKFKKFPSDIRSADGKVLLSWRVPLLQVINGFENIYNEFKLNEPWDSPANKPLLEKMPPIFRQLQLGTNTDEVSRKTKTIIRLFNAPAGVPLSNPNLKFTDLKNPQGTLLFASVPPNLAAEWTKPEDLVWDANKAEELFGNVIFAVSFNGAVDAVPLIPLDAKSDDAKKNEEQKKEAEQQRKFLDAFVRGTLEVQKPAAPQQNQLTVMPEEQLTLKPSEQTGVQTAEQPQETQKAEPSK